MPNDDAQERALSTLEEALLKAEVLLVSSAHDQLLVKSLLVDLHRVRAQLDALRFSESAQKIPEDKFWPIVSPIFFKVAELLLERLFK